MTQAEIQDLIRSGESSSLEFKEERVSADSLAAEIVAFANFEGGRIILGVGDQGNVEGCRRPDLETFVINICRHNVRPALIPILEPFDLEGNKLWIVTIPRGETVYGTNRGQHFIRVGSTRQIPSQQELLRLFQRKNVLQFDETPVLKATSDDLHLSALQDYLSRLGQSPLDPQDPASLRRDLRSLGVTVEFDDQTHPTLAGFLAFGRDPQRFFPSYQIRCAAYKGEDVAAPVIRDRDLNGRLSDLVEDTLAFLKLTIPVTVRMQNRIQRHQSYAYPVEALREAVVNAICHRDYSIVGSAIRVLVFRDRVEIRSPGGLPNTMTLESLDYRQFTRNQTIASYLAGWGYMERRGKGILQIRRTCAMAGASVDFQLTPDQHEFFVSFRRADVHPPSLRSKE